VTRSGSQIAGPAVAGFLIQLIGGARAVAVDAASFLVSALALALIKKPEPVPQPGTASGQTGFLVEMREGVEVVFKNPLLWRIAATTATSNLGSNMIFGAVFLVFAYRDLHLTAGLVGLVFAISSVGFLVGAVIAGWAARTIGLGLTLALSILLGGLVSVGIPLARLGAPVVILSVLGFVAFLMGPIYNINQVSLRQAITPDRVQGRMNATMRTIVWGTIPIGAVVGGILGTAIGVVPTIILGSLVSAAAALWLFFGPVVGLKRQPEPVPA
jgi:predicted MFS family arabinose efflux permease